MSLYQCPLCGWSAGWTRGYVLHLLVRAHDIDAHDLRTPKWAPLSITGLPDPPE